MVKSKVVSIVFSFRNEEKNIPELLRRTINVLEKEHEDYELVFVNDDSTDGSLELLKNRRKENPRIKIVNMSRRFGVYECMMAGMAHATGDAVVYLDSDLQDPPEILPRMLEKWRAGFDVVHTVRTSRPGESAFKMWLTRQAYRILSATSEVPLPVEAGDYKLLSRRCVDRLVTLRESDPYFRGLATWIGYPQSVVEYKREARGAGRSQRGMLTSAPWLVFMSGLTSFTFIPLYFILAAGTLSLVAVVAAILGGIAATFLGGGFHPIIWLILLVLFLWSSLLASLGTVGIYVARTYKDVRGRPLYIVRETIGFDAAGGRK